MRATHACSAAHAGDPRAVAAPLPLVPPPPPPLVPPLLPPNGGGERRVTLLADVQLSADDGRDLENQLRGLVQSHRPQQVK